MPQKPKIKVVLKKRDGGLTNPDSELNKRLTTIKNSNINIIKKIALKKLKTSIEYKSRLKEFYDDKLVTKMLEKRKIKDISEEYKKEIHIEIPSYINTPEKMKAFQLINKTRMNFQILFMKTKKYYNNTTRIKKENLNTHVNNVFQNIDRIPKLGLTKAQTITKITESMHTYLVESLKKVNELDSQNNLKNIDSIINIWKELDNKVDNKIKALTIIDLTINYN